MVCHSLEQNAVNISIDALKKRILAAKGEIRSDLVLKKGDEVTVEVTGAGRLTNRVA